MAINGTLELIDSVTVGSGGAASIEFTSIPQTYDDLVVKVSSRITDNGGSAWINLAMTFNNSTTGYSGKLLYGTGSGSGASINEDTTAIPLRPTSSLATASTFGSAEVYIPNYKSSNNKSFSIDNVSENNATAALAGLSAGLWSNSAAITSIKFTPASGLVAEHSTAYLYGVTRVPAGAKATGGVISETDTHWVHTFTSSGVFTPLQNITCDYLVVAGGAGGGATFNGDGGGGGGAGGLRCTVTATGGGGSLESALSLNSSTNYTVTIGAGGAGQPTGWTQTFGSDGSNSVFSTITSTGGGGGSGQAGNGRIGGSGGGAGGRAGANRTGGAGTANQGYAGGNTTGNPNTGGAGGGGSNAVGQSITSDSGGNGGGGVATLISGTSTNYAGGGGGGTRSGGSAGTATAGGGNGGAPGASGNSATQNTGSGGGGSGSAASSTLVGGNGGSGIVIVRYAK